MDEREPDLSPLFVDEMAARISGSGPELEPMDDLPEPADLPPEAHVMVLGEEPAGMWVGCSCGWEGANLRFDEDQATQEHSTHLAGLETLT